MTDKTKADESKELLDPPVRRYPEFRLKKLIPSAPGHIRMVNKAGSALSVGTRAVVFRDYGEPAGLVGEDAEDMRKLIDEFQDLNDGRYPHPVDQLNMLCESRANWVVAETYPSNGGMQILVYFDVFMEGEELEEYEEVSEMLVNEMKKRKAEREEAKLKTEEATKAADAQRKEDEKLGKMAREQGLVEEVRTLREQVAKIRKAGNKLAQKLGMKEWLNEEA